MSIQIHKITNESISKSLQTVCMDMGRSWIYEKRFSIGTKPDIQDFKILSSYMRILDCKCLLNPEEVKKLKEKTNKLLLKHS